MPVNTPAFKTPSAMPAGKPMGEKPGKPMNVWMIVSAILAIALIISVASALKGGDASFKKISGEQAGNVLIEFVNEIYAAQIGQSTLKSVTAKNGLYEVVVAVDNGGQAVDQTVFVSQDGLLFIPQALDIEDVRTQYRAFQQSGQNTPTVDPNAQTVPAGDSAQPEGEEAADQ